MERAKFENDAVNGRNGRSNEKIKKRRGTWWRGEAASGPGVLVGVVLRRRDGRAGGDRRARDGGRRRHLHRRVGGAPVGLEVVGDVLARVLQLVLVEHDVEHLVRALGQLLGGHHLDVEVAALRLAARLDQPLQHLCKNTKKNVTNCTWDPSRRRCSYFG